MIIQPVLASYRLEFFNELSKYYGDVVIYADHKPSHGFSNEVNGLFKLVRTKTFGKRSFLYYQTKILSSIIKNKPELIFITADTRAIHFWLVLFLCKINDIPIFCHGQGLYHRPDPSLFIKVMYKLITDIASCYFCYTKISKDSLIGIGVNDSKAF